jgi:hypothetical protein
MILPLKPSEVILYAAVPLDYQMALGAAGLAGIPTGNVTTDFQKAWGFVSAGSHLVLAVGHAALNALYYNPCGWTNPASGPGGHTPFNMVATPRASLLGPNVFVNAAGVSAVDTLQIAGAFAYYAVAGSLPHTFLQHPNPVAPTEVCMGAPTVACPCTGSSTAPKPVTTSPPPPSPSHSLPYWGVDSAGAVNTNFYNCVVQHYGTPVFWGRYLKTINNVSDGLSASEISFLHARGVKILAIYNNFSSATGNANGQANANNAIAIAKSLGVPANVAIFADIEESYAVDASWIEGWVDVMSQSQYMPGIYNNPISGKFPGAYAQAVKNNANIAKTVVLWSNEREPGITTKAMAPVWNPAAPPTPGRVLAWQYGENGSACQPGIDTDLIDPGMYAHLW